MGTYGPVKSTISPQNHFQSFLLSLYITGESSSTIARACKQALWGTLAAGQQKEGQLVTTSLECDYLH